MTVATAMAAQNRGVVPMLEARSVSRTFRVSVALFKPKRILRAVEGVSLAVRPGEVVALGDRKSDV